MTPKERREHLAAFLDTLPDDYLCLDGWYRHGKQQVPVIVSDVVLPPECGTAACAVGWACCLPAFNAEGLVRDIDSPKFGDLLGWPAVRRFFGLYREEAYYLFKTSAYVCSPSPQTVAQRIRSIE